MATGNLDPNNFVHRIRMLVGDFMLDEPYLQDDVYVWLYGQNGNSEIDAAVEALETIINHIALSPQEWRIGDAQERGASVSALTQRLRELKTKQKGTKVPVVIKTDRTNWDDFDKVF